MKKIPYFLVLVAISCLLNSCSRSYYFSDEFHQKVQHHQSIAVLPVEMIFTGKIPEDLSDSDILSLEEAESEAFQRSLLQQLISNHSRKRRKKGVLIDFQSAEYTNSLLKQENISIRKAWNMPANELASVLGVDAVIKSNVVKTRYMSDLASMGVSLGIKLINVLTRFQSAPYMPYHLRKTGDIQVNCDVLDGKNGTIVWSTSFNGDTDWTDPSAQVLSGINQQIAKDFPYRAR